MMMGPVVLYLPRMRVYLTEFHLVRGYRLTVTVEDEEPGTGRSLVDGSHEDLGGLHGFALRSPRGKQNTGLTVYWSSSRNRE